MRTSCKTTTTEATKSTPYKELMSRTIALHTSFSFSTFLSRSLHGNDTKWLNFTLFTERTWTTPASVLVFPQKGLSLQMSFPVHTGIVFRLLNSWNIRICMWETVIFFCLKIRRSMNKDKLPCFSRCLWRFLGRLKAIYVAFSFATLSRIYRGHEAEKKTPTLS